MSLTSNAAAIAAQLDPARLREANERLMQRIVLVAERNVKRQTRVRTGNLRRSWTSRVEAAGERGVVGTNVTYARYQRNRPAEEGLDVSRPEIDALLAESGRGFLGGVTG